MRCAALLGVGGMFALHLFDSGGNFSQITGDQLSSLQVAGVWHGPDGATITLSGNGKFTSANVSPGMFVISEGQWPQGNVDGTWGIGLMSPSGWTEQGVVLSAPALLPGQTSPKLMLLPVGSTSSPELACYYPVDAGICVFTR